VAATFRSFNRWLDDDWGLHHRDRIFGVPYIPLVDAVFAVDELEWALARGARVVCMRPAAPTIESGPRSPAHRSFDPFWARVQEAGIAVAIHAGNSGYGTNGYADDGQFEALETNPLNLIMTSERPPMDFFAALLCDGLFVRFPGLRLASIENGAGWLEMLFRKLRKAHHQRPGFFAEDPVETFRRHVWINPFWEDDVEEVVELMSADRVLFGSDWPHAEGLVDPLDYTTELKMFGPVEQRSILRDNSAALTGLRPA
jgi:predicted TIM-barrel fold metal-dependent hydrolase